MTAHSDVWEPLLAIAECVGGDWPRLAREAAITLSDEDGGTEEKGVELLRPHQGGVRPHRLASHVYEDAHHGAVLDEERPWSTWNDGKPITARQIAGLLKPFKIISETVHPHETGEPKAAKGYRRSRFEGAFDTYLAPPIDASAQFSSSQACVRASAEEMGTTSDFCIRAENNSHAYEKCEKSANSGDLHACTDKNTETGHETQ